MAQIAEIAQNLMDLYYQQFKSDEDFLEFYHFEYLTGVIYARLMQDEYEKSYRQSIAEGLPGQPTLNPEWYVTEVKELQKSDMGDGEIVLEDCPFTFSFDKQSSGIQGIYPLNGTCSEFIRITVDDLWKLKTVPTTSVVFWFPLANKIIFKNIQCGLKEVRVPYIPSLKMMSEKCGIPDSLVEEILRRGLELLAFAKNGTVVDMTNDQNPNKVLETELNTAFRNLKTKP